jgi:hypothetical protein
MEIKADGWHHIAVTKVGSDITVYDRALSTGEVTKHYEKAVLAESPVAYWRLGDTAHPDWKFGDVVQHPDMGPPVFITAQVGAVFLGVTLDGGLLYSIPVEIAGQWKLVPEPDD